MGMDGQARHKFQKVPIIIKLALRLSIKIYKELAHKKKYKGNKKCQLKKKEKENTRTQT